MSGGRTAATVNTLREGSDQETLQPHDQRRRWGVSEMLLPDIDCGGRNHGLYKEVMQYRRGNRRPCDIGLPAGFAARFAMFEAQRGNRGAVLAIRHRGCSLRHVLQAGGAGIGRNALLCQQHEADGAYGEPFPEVDGEAHAVMVLWSTYGHKWLHPSEARAYIKGLLLENHKNQYFRRLASVEEPGRFRFTVRYTYWPDRAESCTVAEVTSPINVHQTWGCSRRLRVALFGRPSSTSGRN